MALRLKAELGGDGSGFDAMMRRANLSVGKLGGVFGGVKGAIAGAFTVGAISSFSNKVIQTASALRDLSDRLGVNVEWLQETGFAAKQAGANIEDVTKFLDQLAINREQALRGGAGGETKQAAFSAVGVSEDLLKKGNLQQIFDQVAQAYQTGNQQKLLPALREIGGKSGGALVAAFVQGLDENRQLARDAGVVMSANVIDSLKALSDEMTTLNETLTAQFAPVIVTVVGWFTKLIDKLAEVRDFLAGWLVGGILLGGSGAMDLGGEMAAEREAAQKERDQQLKLAREARRKAALEKDTQLDEDIKALVSLDPTPKPTKPGSGPGPQLVTDSLVGVGNFLGRNPALVNAVANQQLQATRDHVRIAQQTYQLLRDRLTSASETATSNFPST